MGREALDVGMSNDEVYRVVAWKLKPRSHSAEPLFLLSFLCFGTWKARRGWVETLRKKGKEKAVVKDMLYFICIKA